jgi:hypothetical protein
MPTDHTICDELDYSKKKKHKNSNSGFLILKANNSKQKSIFNKK